MENYLQLFLEAKDRFINKLNLSDEEKQTLIDFFKKHPQYENKIDWNNKNLTMDDFKPVLELDNKSNTKLKQRFKAGEKRALFERGKFIIYKETPKWLYVLPTCWEDAKFMDSTECGGEGAKWCIGWKKAPEHWDGYTSGDKPDRTSSFVLAFNKLYNVEDFINVPKVPAKDVYDTDSEELVWDPYSEEYNELFRNGKCLKYMIQILDNPEEQTDVYGADESDPDHLVWTQDDKPENVVPLHHYSCFSELSFADIETIKRIFDKQVRFIDEDAINALEPIEYTQESLEEVNSKPKNNANCPYKVILTGKFTKLPYLSRYIKVTLKDDCKLSANIVSKMQIIDRVVGFDPAQLDLAKISGICKNIKNAIYHISPSDIESIAQNADNLDYFYCWSTTNKPISFENISFDKLENARYTFFSSYIPSLVLNGASFPKLKSVVRCFDNADIDTLEMIGVDIPDSCDLEDMFTNHKIKNLITDNPKIRQAFNEA